jgi:hypothetical protein
VRYYNRQGVPIDQEEWVARSNKDEQRVAQDWVAGKWVSTVWLGINHRFTGDGPPIIFETMVFRCEAGEGPPDSWGELFCKRYATEEEALEGHRTLVETLKAMPNFLCTKRTQP